MAELGSIEEILGVAMRTFEGSSILPLPSYRGFI
jgi:hypothetical protein